MLVAFYANAPTPIHSEVSSVVMYVLVDPVLVVLTPKMFRIFLATVGTPE